MSSYALGLSGAGRIAVGLRYLLRDDVIAHAAVFGQYGKYAEHVGRDRAALGLAPQTTPAWLLHFGAVVDGLPAWAQEDLTGGTAVPPIGTQQAAKRALRAAAIAGLPPSRVIGGADGDIAILFSAGGDDQNQPCC